MSKNYIFPLFFLILSVEAYAMQISFPSWGFFTDLPEEYELADGDMQSVYSFASPAGAIVNIRAYQAGAYQSVEALAGAIQKQLNNRGEADVFEYRGKKAVILELAFSLENATITGFGLCLELGGANASTTATGMPFLLALAYGDAASGDLTALHLSSLDSIAPDAGSLHAPGPIVVYSFPRGERKTMALAGGAGEAAFFERDAEAAQFVVDREDMVLRRYLQTPLWKDAWIRFYRTIYRDSFERLQNAAFTLERLWNITALDNGTRANGRAFASAVLKWAQGFQYERDIEGSDFVNLVSAAIEGRGDCDSRALLWAVIMEQAGVRAGIMVSVEYSHAMGIVDVDGEGARFPLNGKNWLVAETTAHVDIGLIGQSMSDANKWIGITFE
jgi:hypothetical protein